MTVRRPESARRLRRLAVLGAASLTAAMMTLSAQGATQRTQSGATAKQGGTLELINDWSLPFQCNYNPFEAFVNYTATPLGYLYEPLVITNAFYRPGVPAQYPWLASSYKWSSDNRTVTFTIRNGVKWSDGQPLTAADVLFTFQLIKKFPALDEAGAWKALASIRQEGTDKIVATLKPGHIPGFDAIASNTYIVPKHIWASIANPVKYVDVRPVVSGPMTVASCSPQLQVYQKNPLYWQASKVQVSKIVMPDYTSNDTANHDLETSLGDGAWGWDFIPNIHASYIAKGPQYRHYWFPPVNNWGLFPNDQNPLLKSPLVRQAIAFAINRNVVSQKAEFGYVLPGSQTGNISTFKAWYNKAADAKYNYFKYNPSKAVSLLQQAGFKRGSDGIFRNSAGQKLTLSIIIIGAYSDSVAAAQVMAGELKAVGIDATSEPLSANTYSSRLANGDYTLAWSQVAGGVTPYYEYYNLLDSANTAPLGKPAASNYERWKDPTTDKLLASYASTRDPKTQHQIIDQIQEIMVDEVPVIPVLQGVDWGEWGDKAFVGWPTPQNPYISPCGYCTSDAGVGVILTHLRAR